MARSSSTYSSAIDGLKVETNSKYLPSGGNTYCNIFAQDVMKTSNISCPLPSGTSTTMYNALYGNKTPGWYSVDFKDAQSRANQGYPTVGIQPGHVVVVRPKTSSITLLKEVQIAQAGATNYNSTTINYAWTATALTKVKFYTHD